MLINDIFKTDLNSALSDELLKSWAWKGDNCITRASHVAERTNGKVTPDRILCFYALCRPEFSRKGRQSDRFTNPRLSHYEKKVKNPSTNCQLG